MSEWGRYFKNAVANVEQTLDKVLLEERPKQETAEKAVDLIPSAEDALIVPKSEIVPDLHPAVAKAQKLALSVHNDAALELLDVIEAASKELDRYVESNTEKMLAAQQKLKLVCKPSEQEESGATASSSGTKEMQIKQLVEEGQQLAQQELKLNLLVKQLRGEKQQLQSKLAALNKQAQDVETLQTQLQKARAQAAEFEALSEHYRQNAVQEPLASVTDTELAPQLQIEKKARENERNAFSRLESQLLARIADLEQLAKTRLNSVSELQSLLASSQQELLAARNTAVELGDELSRLKDECDRLAQQKRETSKPENPENPENPEDPEEAIQTMEIKTTDKEVEEEKSGDETGDATIDAASEAAIETANDNAELADEFQFSSPQLISRENSPEMPVSPVNGKFNQFGAVFPSLGDPVNADDMDEPLPEPMHSFSHADDSALSLESLRHYSVDSFDTLEALDNQRRFSEGEPESAPPRIVHQLSLKIRKLERELANSKRVAQMMTEQNEAAQTDLAKLIDADEQLEVLQRRYDAQLASDVQLKAEFDDLKTQNARKEELIAELEADVEDVKMAYKQQILDLVAELEAKQ